MDMFGVVKQSPQIRQKPCMGVEVRLWCTVDDGL